ncbi:zinc finger CCCH-type with G patch domain-containing protein [Aedes albopictus]|uniref:Zinc finger CCCH-type with G patch domain-containing protein n=1 Tax=Aedes albopictus TaxID=7160 RepID=A0A023EUK9_AEDAL
MSSCQDLNESIQLYNEQLVQVNQALESAGDGPERESLLNLKSDLEELLKLTLETVEHETDDDPDQPDAPASGSSNEDDEFALFMSEINALDAPKPEAQPPSKKDDVGVSEQDPFKDLVGSKCSAPHVHKWGSKSYHNALICSLDSSDLEDVSAKVLFINPTHQEMIPCVYFLEGDCKFDDEKCRFSHGEVVPVSELKEYRQPRFELLKRKGCRVLAKHRNRIWSKGTIKQVDFDSKTCKIQMDEGRHEVELQFEDILPMEDDGASLSSDSESNTDSEEEKDEDVVSLEQAQIIQRSLLNPAPDQRLGDWEKHTKGIGSKIMLKMGYVVGAGLGSRGEGIVVPVSAQVLPQGRSLDYCMQLREQANGDKNLFSVEKKLLRQKRIQEKRDSKNYAKNKPKKDVFNFLNSEIFGSNSSLPSPSTSRNSTGNHSSPIDLPGTSSKNLNIASLKLTEQMRRLEMDIEKLSHSLTRHQPGSKMHSNLQRQIADKRREVSEIQKTEYSISREQQLRSDKRKMTVF